MSKAKKIAEHLKFLRFVQKNWDLYTQGSSGVFKNQVRIHTRSGQLFLKKSEIDKHIEMTKKNLKNHLKAYGFGN